MLEIIGCDVVPKRFLSPVADPAPIPFAHLKPMVGDHRTEPRERISVHFATPIAQKIICFFPDVSVRRAGEHAFAEKGAMFL